MQEIFSDFIIQTLQSDPEEPGVFLKARKPLDYAATGTLVHFADPLPTSEYEGKLVRRIGKTLEDGKVRYTLSRAAGNTGSSRPDG